MNYWQKREAEQRIKYGDLTHKQIRKKSAKLYKRKLSEVEHLMKDLYDQILVDGTPSANELYRYNRMYKASQELQEILRDMNESYISILTPSMKKLYIDTYTMTSNSIHKHGFDKKEAERVAENLWNRKPDWSKNVWCRDGKSSSYRVNKNLNKLQQTLEDGLVDIVARGQSKDKLVEKLQERFNVSFHEADRLARTEVSHLQNQATMDSYVEEGVEKYQFLAEIDNRTSDICIEHNGLVYNTADAIVGENYPPLHVNCRSTTIPYLNRNFNRQLAQRAEAARDERANEKNIKNLMNL